MPRTCLACTHPDRAAIDKALVAGEPLRNIAKRVSISYSSLFRHKSHLAGDGGDLSTQMREVTGFSALPPRKQKYIEGRIEGKTKVQAALAAGYSKGMANSAAHSIETKEVRAVFAELVRKRIPPEKIVQRIEEGMDATETKFFQKDGVVTDSRDLIAWSERREYTEIAAEYGGYFAPRDDGGGDTNVGIAITVHHVGESNGDEAAPVAPMPSDETARGPTQSAVTPSGQAQNSLQPSSSTVPHEVIRRHNHAIGCGQDNE